MTSKEFQDRLTARALRTGLTLPADELNKLETYYRLLARWNQTINLTALALEPVTDQAIDRLLVEPLVAAGHVLNSTGRWFDLGSGGGSPAIPLKVARPAFNLIMVESRERKAAFLREVVRELGMADVVVLSERFETLASKPDFAGIASLVTVRAVRIDQKLLQVSRRLLSTGGKLFLFGAPETLTPDESLFSDAQTLELIPDSTSNLLILTVDGHVPRETR